MQVGLGSARNFSSARPIFQNLAQNVPIAGRAFWEADWDVTKMRDECRVQMGKENGHAKAQAQLTEMIKPIKASSPLFTEVKTEVSVSDTDSEAAADLEHYFPTANKATEGLTTYLLIPLAPTPTSRLPLASSPVPTSERLLPLSELANMHYSHSTHSLRVSSLFARLDVANVWHRGVSHDAYSTGRRGDGVCTMLRVSFAGWSAAEVRSVIGESGTGWCELYEARTSSADTMSESDFDTEDGASEVGMDAYPFGEVESHDAGADENQMDPSQSFVMPTLDFSSSFPASSPPALSRAPSEVDIDMFAFASTSPSSDDAEAWEMATNASSDGDSDESWAQPSVHSHSQPSSRFGLGFSSEFAGRARL